jgi:hypothetical protein
MVTLGRRNEESSLLAICVCGVKFVLLRLFKKIVVMT